jgi:ABC-type bacteriocin/lantibiotic exporter with double-glycine peptidase domain
MTMTLSVALPVQLVPQPTDVSCWAASMAMVAGYRDSASYSADAIAAQAGMDTATGYGWNDIQSAVNTWGLRQLGPASQLPSAWADQLQTYGPIWIVETGAPYHAVVVVGINGDGTPEGTTVTLNNPWPPGVGAVENKSFIDFDSDFGLGAGADAQNVSG